MMCPISFLYKNKNLKVLVLIPKTVKRFCVGSLVTDRCRGTLGDFRFESGEEVERTEKLELGR